jgi:hypothetical protein
MLEIWHKDAKARRLRMVSPCYSLCLRQNSIDRSDQDTFFMSPTKHLSSYSTKRQALSLLFPCSLWGNNIRGANEVFQLLSQPPSKFCRKGIRMNTIIGTATVVINKVRSGRNSIIIKGSANTANTNVIKG